MNDDMLYITVLIDELLRIRDEFGEVGCELLDFLDMDMRQPVTHVRYDPDRERVQFISDR